MKIDDPYPEDVFPPLSEDEVRRCVEALTALDSDGHLCERLHAQWARHLQWVAEQEASDG